MIYVIIHDSTVMYMSHESMGTKARWQRRRKARRERLADARSADHEIRPSPPGPADTRPERTYGVRMRHNDDAARDSWATLVRRNRERLQMSQQQLADALGIKRETVSRWESGKLARPAYDTAVAAIRALGIDRTEGLRVAGYAEGDEQPDPYAYVREMGLDPSNRVVRRILNLAGVSEEFRMRALRREKQMQLRDEQARLDALEWAVEEQAEDRRNRDAG